MAKESSNSRSGGCSINPASRSPFGVPAIPGELAPLPDVIGWKLDHDALKDIDAIVAHSILDPVGPEFMALSP
jgi:hypothetical protein